MIILIFIITTLLNYNSEKENELIRTNNIIFEDVCLLLSSDGYSVDKFYKKIDLDYGTLDENGDLINFIFAETSIETGDYEIKLTDGPGNLYNVKGTNLYMTFVGYFGYAGYGTECILRVSEYYSSTVYKIE